MSIGNGLCRYLDRVEHRGHPFACAKICVDDPNWIIILFVIHIDAFRVKKLEESTHGTVFTDESQFGETRSETFPKCFEASNEIFGGKTLKL